MKVVTDRAGMFTFPAVPSNTYELRFDKLGFAPLTMDAAQVIAIGTVVMKVTAPAESPIPSSIGISAG